MKLTCLKLFIFLMCPSAIVMAQDEVNMKFGKPTKTELQMSVYEPEPEASAVVLCRLTDVEYTVQTSSFLVDYHEKCRVKVLKPEGAKYAKVVIPYKKNMSVGNNISGLRASFVTIPMDRVSGNSSFQDQDGSMSEGVFGTEGDESVESLKATAYNQEGSKVVKTSLKKSDIVTRTIDEQHYEVEFTVPGVKEGSVIEYEYTIHSQVFWELHDWFAQRDIPVVYAKLDMNIPDYLIFNIEEHGIQRLTYTCTAGTLKYKVESDPLANQMWVKTNHYVFVGRNLISMPKDDYVWNVEDYCAGITAELKQYRLRGMSAMEFALTWDQIDAMVLASDDLGIHLNDCSPLVNEVKDAKIETVADMKERVAAVYNLVMSKVKWNGKYNLSPVATSETLKKGSGTNADINLLLIQTLHDAGLTAAPVLLRTRNEGLLPYNFPSISKLSTFIVGVVLPSGDRVFLDASSKDGFLNVLAEPLLVEKARLVMKNKSAWVDLQRESKSQKNTIIEGKIAADGLFTGKMTTRYEGLAAMKYRQEKGVSAFAPDATESTDFSVQGKVSDGEITFCPYPQTVVSNPFKAASRKVPVEFSSLSSDRIVINIVLPEGYTLKSEPKNTIITSPDKGIDARFFFMPGENQIQMTCQINVNKIVHSEKSYTDLRTIFDMISRFTSEELTISK